MTTILELKEEIFSLKYENDNPKKNDAMIEDDDDDVQIIEETLAANQFQLLSNTFQISSNQAQSSNFHLDSTNQARSNAHQNSTNQTQTDDLQSNFRNAFENSPARRFSEFHLRDIQQSNYRENSDEEESLLVEINQKRKEKNFECKKCNKKFLYKKRFKTHVEIFHRTEKRGRKQGFRCDLPDCDFKTKFKPAMLRHTKSHTAVTLKCGKCDYETNFKKRLENHEALKHGGSSGYGSESPRGHDIPIGRI
jgi:hypothetical protein